MIGVTVTHDETNSTSSDDEGLDPVEAAVTPDEAPTETTAEDAEAGRPGRR